MSPICDSRYHWINGADTVSAKTSQAQIFCTHMAMAISCMATAHGLAERKLPWCDDQTTAAIEQHKSTSDQSLSLKEHSELATSTFTYLIVFFFQSFYLPARLCVLLDLSKSTETLNSPSDRTLTNQFKTNCRCHISPPPNFNVTFPWIGICP